MLITPLTYSTTRSLGLSLVVALAGLATSARAQQPAVSPPVCPAPAGGAAGAAAAAQAPAPASVTPRPASMAVRPLLEALAADSMEGRGTGTRGSARAARLIASQMQAAGLVPAGDSGYFQRVPLRLRTVQGRVRASAVRSWAEYNALPADQRTIGVNVVGILPGTDAALRCQAILVDAHYDHEGMGTTAAAVDGDSIFNGADDDASGTVAVLEIARVLGAERMNKRTIVFAATTGEEVGLIGTQWYIANPPFPLQQTVANFEIEMIGRPDSLAGGAGKGWLTGYDLSSMGPTLAAAGIPVVADPRPRQNFFSRSDNIAFARMGIVAHTYSSFNLHTDYHTVNDETDKVDWAHMTALAAAAVRAVRVLANGEIPVWDEGDRPTPSAVRLVVPPTAPPPG